jgi:MFS family permease
MVNPASPAPTANENAALPWYRLLNGYHWLVLCVSTVAWAFDCLSQQLFNLTRKPAMEDLATSRAGFFSPLSTSALLVGWATGGIIFGILGDRIGRAKTLTIMIVCYSLSTGLCGLSVGPWDYVAYCFLTGVGAGGIFPIACTLVAESLPDRTRAQALGTVQVFSAFGNISAGLISLGFVALLAGGVISTHWRWMFSVGIVPSLLAILVARRLREPEAWKRAVAEGKTKKAGLGELFADRRWRRNAIVGLLLASSGVVGLWGIGVFSNDLTQFIIGDRIDAELREKGEAEKDLEFVVLAVGSAENLAIAKSAKVESRHLLGIDPRDRVAARLYGTALEIGKNETDISRNRVLDSLKSVDGKRLPTEEAAKIRDQIDSAVTKLGKVMTGSVATSIHDRAGHIVERYRQRNIEVLRWAAWTLICFNIGAFFGMYAFARVTLVLGRRPTFAIFFTIALVATVLAFGCMKKMPGDLWMVALMGGAQLSVFGGYAIYFPELFPTRLRSTGTSFCYNVGRYVSAVGGPLLLIVLRPALVTYFQGDEVAAFRCAGITMSACFLVGIAALWFAPETKGQPLPD